MTTEQYIDACFEHARNEEPFIPIENVRDLLNRHTAHRNSQTSDKRFQSKFILIPAAIAVVLLGFYFFRPSQSDIQTPQSISGTKSPPVLHKSDNDFKQQQPSSNSSTQSEANTTVSPNTGAPKRTIATSLDSVSGRQKSIPFVLTSMKTPLTIAPLRIYILDTLELAKIGIFLADNGITESWMGTTQLDTALDGSTTYILSGRANLRKMLTDSIRNRFGSAIEDRFETPVAIECDELGRAVASQQDFGRHLGPDLTKVEPSSQNRTHIDYCFDNLDPQLQKLIPIKVSSKHQTKIFWLYPTPELLLRLPERLQKELQQRENEKRIRKSSGPRPFKTNDIRIALRSGETPEQNPEVELELCSQHNLRMALFDIQGALVKEVTPLQKLRKGTFAHEVDVQGISAGVYLFAVLSNTGEQEVRRICVR